MDRQIDWLQYYMAPADSTYKLVPYDELLPVYTKQKRKKSVEMEKY